MIPLLWNYTVQYLVIRRPYVVPGGWRSWSQACGERCLRLMVKDEFFLVEEAVCSVVFADELVYLLFLLLVSTLLRLYPINLSGEVGGLCLSSVASCVLEQYKEVEAIWCPVVCGHRECVVQMRIPALDEETPCFVCLPA
ncbi:hypothetical protein F2Q69_00021492 [Brassica cretica]|uniref:Rhodanese domain-containing protein n=1 Tax=Brassica cretica TaxID=69181 RepID=A0A8S9QLV4_BRACR|nr:hypothetical protein F2Q69_00021492 [Brassica cretica]